VISHACISAEGSESTVASTRAINSVRPLPGARAQGQCGRARAPHVARQPQVHSILQDHQHVTPLSANKLTTTFSPLKMGAIYALPPDMPPFHSQIRRSPSLRMADLTGRRVSITSSNPLDSDRPKRKDRISRSVRSPGEGFGDDTNHPRQDLAAIRRIAQRPRFRCQSLEAAVALRLDTYRLSCLA
jgi:hypothetical protein